MVDEYCTISVQHRRLCHLSAERSCPDCDYRTRHATDLKRHILVKHGTYDDLPFQCSYCLKRFVMSNALKKHEASESMPVVMCKCIYSLIVFTLPFSNTFRLFINLMQSSRQAVRLVLCLFVAHEGDRPVLVCDQENCDFKTQSESSMVFHTRKHK